MGSFLMPPHGCPTLANERSGSAPDRGSSQTEILSRRDFCQSPGERSGGHKQSGLALWPYAVKGGEEALDKLGSLRFGEP